METLIFENIENINKPLAKREKKIQDSNSKIQK